MGSCVSGRGNSREARKGKVGGRTWNFRWASPEFLLASDTVWPIIPPPWVAGMFMVQKGLVGCMPDAHQDHHQLRLRFLLSVSVSSPLPSSENQGSGDLPTGLWWVGGSHLDLVQFLSNLPLSLHPPLQFPPFLPTAWAGRWRNLLFCFPCLPNVPRFGA